jgi:hypothetical protein
MNPYDDDYTMINPRSYQNPITGYWIFMDLNTTTGMWSPHISTMRAWGQGTLRVYRPCDNPTTLVSMPGHHRWPAMDPRDYGRIASATVPAAWIADNLIHDGITETGIDSADRCLTSQHDPTHDQMQWALGAMLASTLPPPPTRSIHASAALALLMLLDTPEQPQHPSTKTTTVATTLPPHVAALVLKEAVAGAATCPITMEPITQSTGVVTGCGHVFQRDAVAKWLGEHGTCPECRQPTKI